MAENEVPTTPLSHTAAAQERIQEIRHMRQQIPNFVFPSSPDERQKLSRAAAVPPIFIELTTVAVQNSAALVRGESTSPAEVRDLVSFADAYEPVATELETLAQLVRHSVTAARNKVGTDALTTYALASRLAKQAATADLAPLVKEMRRVLGKSRKAKNGSVETAKGSPAVTNAKA